MRIDGAVIARRRRISLTSLIDVIFLLLLFFMLTSTFSRFGDVELTTGGVGPAQASPQQTVFVQLRAGGLTFNGEPVALEALGRRLGTLHEAGAVDAVVLSVRDGATAQQLVDVIAAVSALGDLPLQIVR